MYCMYVDKLDFFTFIKLPGSVFKRFANWLLSGISLLSVTDLHRFTFWKFERWFLIFEHECPPKNLSLNCYKLNKKMYIHMIYGSMMLKNMYSVVKRKSGITNVSEQARLCLWLNVQH